MSEKSTMNKETFHASSQYRALTEKQRTWVDSFADFQDAALATQAAYGVAGTPYAAMLSRKIETSPRVIAALDFYFARTPRDRFIRDLQYDIRRSKGIARIEAQRLYAKFVFGDAVAADGESSSVRFHVGQRVTQRDSQTGELHIGVVKSVDPNGRPTQIEAINV